MMFYPKLAAVNLRKNARTYIPYILTCMLTIGMFYIMRSLSLNEGINAIYGAETIRYTLGLGCYVIGFFAFIFLFYTNSFLTKTRKKEFGLFNILGMEKKHLSFVMAFESLYAAVISFIGGIGAGILLDKLMYLVIIKLLKGEIALGFYISKTAILDTLKIFGILFFLIFLNSLRTIHLTKPIALLKGGNIGEKEPKAKWLLALLGLGSLGAGYYIAVTTKNPVSALFLFFIAVVLVIVGTYLLFTSVSIAFLKILKSSRSYYYQTNHFISISGMLYRMKQNAVGLANICILSTMVLVMVSSTSSLMIGTQSILKERYPFQIQLQKWTSDPEENAELLKIIQDTAKKENVTIEREEFYSYLEFAAMYQGNNTFEVSPPSEVYYIDNVCELLFVTAEDYNNCLGKNVSLAEDEVILWTNRGKFLKEDSFQLLEETFRIREITEDFISDGAMTVNICPTYGIVVKDMAVMESLQAKQQEIYANMASNIQCFYGLDIAGDVDAQKNFYNKLDEAVYPYAEKNGLTYLLKCREAERNSIYSLYGSLFFLGIFLGLLFTMAAVLIIYYKQISEGYDDKERFAIMQKVGLSAQQVKKSIHSQVLTVFFMPLITAGVHTAFAFPIIRRILTMFALTDTKLYICCTIGSFLIFALIYSIIYGLTARVYYKIVKN